MNWINKNKFLSGLIGILVVGIGVFGFLIFNGKSRAGDAREEIKQIQTKYKRAAGSDELPVPAVLEAKEKTVAELEKVTEVLKTEMAEKYGPKVAAGDPSTFGQRVEARYSELRDIWEAEDRKMTVPDEFFLGFENYRTSIQAQPSAVAELDNQLAALSWVVGTAVDTGVDSILRFDREKVAGEEGAAPAEENNNRRGNNNSDQDEPPLNRYHLVASVQGSEPEVRDFLNQVIASDSYLFGVRYIRLRNTEVEGPSRSNVESQVKVAAPAAPASDSFGFDFGSFEAADDGAAEDEAAVVEPDAEMSDAERRAARVAGEQAEEVAAETADDVPSADAAARLADFTEEPGVQDAVVFLGQEDVVLTVVLDYISMKPVASDAKGDEAEAAE